MPRQAITSLVACAPSLLLVTATPIRRYVRIAHGPIDGAYNNWFLWAFVFWFVIAFVVLAALQPLRINDNRTVKRALIGILIGALLGYVASVLAAGSVLMLHPRLNSSEGSNALTVLPYAAIVLLIDRWAWLVGVGCVATYQALERMLQHYWPSH